MSTVKVTSIAASRCKLTGQVIHTLMCEYPRAIHSQLLTHRVFSKNSSSTRAIPLEKAIKQLIAEPAKQIFTVNEAGMQGAVMPAGPLLDQVNMIHECGKDSAISMARHMARKGVHKQNAGRYLEPYQNIKIILTSTEFANWDHLRMDAAAQGEIRDLAEAMFAARESAEVFDLEPGEFHLPFIKRHRDVAGTQKFYVETEDKFKEVTLEDATKISLSCCAQVSYRNLDMSLEKADELLPKLFGGDKVHASPAEHLAMTLPADLHGPVPAAPLEVIMASLPKGITSIDRDLQLWSGNFKNFIQYRQLLPNHDAALKTDKHAVTAEEMNAILGAILAQ